MKRNNSQSIITLTNLKEIKNIIDPLPSKADLRKTIDLELRKISQERLSRWKNTNQNAFNFELENFIPFESTYSKSIVLYIKIR